MKHGDILRARLGNQRLSAPMDDPGALVAHLGAVQAQDWPAACWALGLRLRDPRLQAIETAFDAGKILRTHVLRPTWHCVAPADIRWMLALTGPRIGASAAAYTRSLGLDDATLASANAVLTQALRGGKNLTRPEIGSLLRESGVAVASGAILGQILLLAEVASVVCSGPRRGRQHTYALLDERVPALPALDRDAAVAELTWRYFNSHGPALVRDCAWWSGLSMGDINRGLQANAHRLHRDTLDGHTYWHSDPPHTKPESISAHLLPNYDEFTVAYRERDLYYKRGPNATADPLPDVPFRHVLLLDGQVVGRWSAARRPDSVDVDIRWSIAPTLAQREAIEAAAERYAAFVGLRLQIPNRKFCSR